MVLMYLHETRPGWIHPCLICCLRWNFLGMTARWEWYCWHFFVFQLLRLLQHLLISVLSFPFVFLRPYAGDPAISRKLMINDTKEKILMNIILLYILLIKKAAKIMCFVSISFFYYYFIGYFYHPILKNFVVIHIFLHRLSKWDKKLSSSLSLFW